MAELYNFTEDFIGDTFTGLIFTYTDENDVAVDISNYVFTVWFRYGNSNGEVLKKITNGDGITILDAVAGKFQIDKFKIEFPAGMIAYDLNVVDNNGDTDTWIYGKWLINNDTTKL